MSARRLRAHPKVAALLPRIEDDVVKGLMTPTTAADMLLREVGLDGSD